MFRYTETPGEPGLHLVRGAASTGILRVLAVGLSFLTNLLLARSMGATEYGLYVYVLSWVGLLSTLGLFGLDRLLVRHVAAYTVRANWVHLRGLMRWANAVGLATSLGLLVLGVCLQPFLADRIDGPLLATAQIGALLIPLSVFIRIQQASLQGLRFFARALLPETVVQPLLVLLCVALIYLVGNGRLSAVGTLVIYIFAAGAALLGGARLLHASLPEGFRGGQSRFLHRTWIRGALPLFFIGGLDALNAQVNSLVLGYQWGSDLVAYYAVASRGAGLVAFVLATANTVLAPSLSGLHAAGEMAELQRLVTRSARAILLGAVPLVVGMILFGNWFLMLFGADFVRGQTALSILSAGQLVNATMGSVGFLLIMTGHGIEAFIGVALGTALNVALSILLIPAWGMEGAAVAAAGSMILWNIILAWFVWKRLGLHTTALGVPFNNI